MSENLYVKACVGVQNTLHPFPISELGGSGKLHVMSVFTLGINLLHTQGNHHQHRLSKIRPLGLWRFRIYFL